MQQHYHHNKILPQPKKEKRKNFIYMWERKTKKGEVKTQGTRKQ